MCISTMFDNDIVYIYEMNNRKVTEKEVITINHKVLSS